MKRAREEEEDADLALARALQAAEDADALLESGSSAGAAAAAAAAPQSAVVCRNFRAGCSLGSRCRYVHPGQARAQPLVPAFRPTGVASLSGAANTGSARLSDLLQGQWQEALLLNFQVDMELLLHACPRLAVAPATVVHGWGSDGHEELQEQCRGPLPQLRLVSPPLPAFGTHHSKAIILFFETGMRLVVTSANFVAANWSIHANDCYLQDFPTKANTGNTVASEFENVLVDYLGRYQELRPILARIRAHDFSAARGVLIPSVPGSHTGGDLHRYGHMRLRRVLSQLEPPPEVGHTHLGIQITSLGAMEEAWLGNEFRSSCFPRATNTVLGRQEVRAPPPSRVYTHLVWPAVEQVRTSNAGYAAGGCIPCPTKNMKPFMRPMLRRYGSAEIGRRGVMPHQKTYTRFQVIGDPQGTGEEDGDMARVARIDWMMIGSHNLSKAAWGSLDKTKTKLHIRSFELSVLLLPQQFQDSNPEDPVFSCTPELEGIVGVMPQRMPVDYRLGDTQWGLPLGYQLPPRAYGPEDQPWLWAEAYTTPDVLGQVPPQRRCSRSA